MPDSDEYIAALERRLARLHNRKSNKPAAFAHRAAGSEFLLANRGGGSVAGNGYYSSSAASSAAAFSNLPRSAAPSASQSAMSNWLDLPDSASSEESVPAAAASAASSAAAADGGGGGGGHSSDEEDEDTAKQRRARIALAFAQEESVALLSRHRQRVPDADVAQLRQAQAEAIQALSPSHLQAAAADTAEAGSAAAVPLPSDSPTAAAAASSSGEPPLVAAQAASASTTAAAAAAAATLAVVPSTRSADQFASSSAADGVSAASSVYAIESSDGDETSAPAHTWRSSVASDAGGAGPALVAAGVDPEQEPDPTSGVMSQRALYYQSAAAVARVTGRIEESEQCVIA